MFDTISRRQECGIVTEVIEAPSLNEAEDACADFLSTWGWGYSPSTHVYPTPTGTWRAQMRRWTSCE
jgi:hypothetical protein